MESWDPLKQISQSLGRGSLLRAQMPVRLPRMLDSWASSACLRVADAASAGAPILLSLLNFSFALVSFCAQGGKLSKGGSVSKSFLCSTVSCGLSLAALCHLPLFTRLGVGT